jgi:hypothetical protein
MINSTPMHEFHLLMSLLMHVPSFMGKYLFFTARQLPFEHRVIPAALAACVVNTFVLLQVGEGDILDMTALLSIHIPD